MASRASLSCGTRAALRPVIAFFGLAATASVLAQDSSHSSPSGAFSRSSPAQDVPTPPSDPVPKVLTDADEKRLAELKKSSVELWSAGKFAEAIAPAEEARNL